MKKNFIQNFSFIFKCKILYDFLLCIRSSLVIYQIEHINTSRRQSIDFSLYHHLVAPISITDKSYLSISKHINYNNNSKNNNEIHPTLPSCLSYTFVKKKPILYFLFGYIVDVINTPCDVVLSKTLYVIFIHIYKRNVYITIAIFYLCINIYLNTYIVHMCIFTNNFANCNSQTKYTIQSILLLEITY